MDASRLKQSIIGFGQQIWIAWLAVILVAALLIGLLAGVVQTFWFSSTPTPAIKPLTVTNTPAVETLSSMHLFGALPNDLTDLPLASLGLQVDGIFLSAQPGESRALISMTGAEPQMYNVGDALPGGVKIYKIMENSVVVSHNNQLEKLPFALQGLDFSKNNNTQQGLFGS